MEEDCNELSWEVWKTELVHIATKNGMEGIDPVDYIDFWQDGYSPQDAWDEDLNNA